MLTDENVVITVLSPRQSNEGELDAVCGYKLTSCNATEQIIYA